MVIQNRTISVALTCTQEQTSPQNLNITNSIEVTIIGVARGGGRGPSPPPIEIPSIKNVTKSLVSSFSVSCSNFVYNNTRVQHYYNSN